MTRPVLQYDLMTRAEFWIWMVMSIGLGFLTWGTWWIGCPILIVILAFPARLRGMRIERGLEDD